MQVGTIEPADHGAVRAIAAECAFELDLEAELARGWAKLWVARAEANAPAIGFLLAWDVADEVHVIHVATRASERRRGVGRALMQSLVEHARARRARLVLLEVRRSNRPALALYKTQGFSAIGLRRGYYSDTREDAVEMMLAFDPQTGRALPPEDALSIGE